MNKKFLAISRGIQGTSIDPKPVDFPNIIFYKDKYPFFKQVFTRFYVEITKHISKSIIESDAIEASIILAVDEKSKISLIQLFPDLTYKIFKLAELVNKNEDFEDPEEITEFQKHIKIFSNMNKTILDGFPKLLALVNDFKKN